MWYIPATLTITKKDHHAFRLSDSESGRTLDGTLAIHTLEHGRYNLQLHDLADASLLEIWLYWLMSPKSVLSPVLRNRTEQVRIAEPGNEKPLEIQGSPATRLSSR